MYALSHLTFIYQQKRTYSYFHTQLFIFKSNILIPPGYGVFVSQFVIYAKGFPVIEISSPFFLNRQSYCFIYITWDFRENLCVIIEISSPMNRQSYCFICITSVKICASSLSCSWLFIFYISDNHSWKATDLLNSLTIPCLIILIHRVWQKGSTTGVAHGTEDTHSPENLYNLFLSYNSVLFYSLSCFVHGLQILPLRLFGYYILDIQYWLRLR